MDWRKSENCCIQKIAFHIVDGEELGEKEGFHIVDGEELGGYPQIIRVIRVIRPNYSMKTYENHLKPMVTLGSFILRPPPYSVIYYLVLVGGRLGALAIQAIP